MAHNRPPPNYFSEINRGSPAPSNSRLNRSPPPAYNEAPLPPAYNEAPPPPGYNEPERHILQRPILRSAPQHHEADDLTLLRSAEIKLERLRDGATESNISYLKRLMNDQPNAHHVVSLVLGRKRLRKILEISESFTLTPDDVQTMIDSIKNRIVKNVHHNAPYYKQLRKDINAVHSIMGHIRENLGSVPSKKSGGRRTRHKRTRRSKSRSYRK